MSDLNSLVSNFAYFNHLIIFLALFFAYNGFSIYGWIVLSLVFTLQFDPQVISIIWYSSIPLFFALPIIRRNLFTKYIVLLINKLNVLPKISDTEETALRSGDSWVDGQLFSGKPNFKWIFKQKYPKLTNEEQSFLDKETEELCKICDDHQTYKDKDLSKEVWKYLKDKKFFGMIIPEQYGGLEFSAFAHSSIIQKLSSRSVPLAITAMVPNSLGPAELLLHYGTKDQQDYYLPRLASGKDIPCFALTEPNAGSDATSITSEGVLFKDVDGAVRIRLNWNKRYITLGAVATVIGLAFQLRDPQNLLGRGAYLGITCALIPNTLDGITQGRRHDPLSTPFINSPINGKNVIAGLDTIIGGEEGIGKGWKMLMESLAAGRGISLPSTSTGGAKLIARVVTAYANVRQQFGLSIGKFEGVQTVLARIVSKTYTLEAMRSFTAGAVDAGFKPAVVTAIAKYHSTEMFREVVNDGMDILGGAGIIRGPRNLIANAYFSVPISITVEGANIMTRSLIHFGQGAIMCHPYVYPEIDALQRNDLRAFDRFFFRHFGHIFRNKIRALLLRFTRGYLFIPHKFGVIGKYERKIAWASATFAFMADVAMLLHGGNLKRKEKLNGRFGDILSSMYMATAVLKKFDVDGRKKEDVVVIDYIMRDLFDKMSSAFDGIHHNIFENKIVRSFYSPINRFFFKFNPFLSPQSDKLEAKLVDQALKSGEFRDNLTKGIYIPEDEKEALGRLENAFLLLEESRKALFKIKRAIRTGAFSGNRKAEDLVDEAFVKKIITQKELDLFKRAKIAVNDAIQVDEYSLADHKKL